MRLRTTRLVFSALCTAALAPPTAASPSAQPIGYDYGFDTKPLIRRQSGSDEPDGFGSRRLVVKGADGSNGTTVPLRMEIHEMQKNQDMWTLFILGLSMMQFEDQDEKTSFYQIAGIHGVPFVTWNGVQPTPGNEISGYCFHENILFPTWHRPYLALYEQILYDHIQQIASWYAEGSRRNRFQRAAVNFRIPYWDWATLPPDGESLLPGAVGASPVVDVDGPVGVQRIANPLFMYQFRPLNASAFYTAPWDQWGGTLRSPSSQTSGATSNNTKVAMTFDQSQAVIQQRVYALFIGHNNYTTFSNEAWFPKGDTKHDSIESVHDTVHTIAGLGGHMTFVPFSSFDPIFWLHHTNLDRLFALWQVLNPDSWIEPRAARMSSYTTSAGQLMTSKTALTPFYANRNGTFWTSDSVRDPEVFNYNYKETVGAKFVGNGGDDSDKDIAARQRVTSVINKLYGQSSPARLAYTAVAAQRPHVKSLKGTFAAATANKPRPGHAWGSSLRGNAWYSSASPDPAPGTVLQEGGRTYVDWVVNVRAEKQALGGTYFIHMFGGAPPTDPDGWAVASNLIGTMSVFASPASMVGHMGHGSNLVAGTIPLTSYLTSRVAVAGDLAGLSVAAVEPYLRRVLQARVALADGTPVDGKTVAGLRLSVASAEVEGPASEFELPRAGEEVEHFEL